MGDATTPAVGDLTTIPDPRDRRRPEHPDRRIVVVGAGPGGIAAAHRLRQAGYHDVVVLDRADGPGGTWRHNRYPGAACDVQSHLYSLSFAPKADWTRPYSPQPEILAYLEAVVDELDLRRHMRFGVEVRSVRWDDAASVWRVATADGPDLEADVVISALGMFNQVNVPNIDGLDSFEGPTVHTARWDPDLDLAGARVAVVGSGASAVQAVPALAEEVGRLHVFQRSAQWILPRQDEPFTDEQKAVFAADPSARLALRRTIWDAVEMAMTYGPAVVAASTEAGRANLQVVEDPELRRRLTPTTPWGCHRPLSSNTYYPAFNRPDVELVTEPIEAVTPSGIRTADGLERPLDAIVLATGFHATRYLSAVDVVGRDGRHLLDTWRDGAQAYLGIGTAGFPNLFQLYGPNTNAGSIIYMIEAQIDYVVRLLQNMDDRGLATTEVRPEVMDAYNVELQQRIDAVEVWHAGCNGYYRSPSGRVVTQWPGGMADYRAATIEIDPGAWVGLDRVPGAVTGPE